MNQPSGWIANNEHNIYFLHFCMGGIDRKWAPEEIKKIEETLSDIAWSKHGEKAKQNFEDEKNIYDGAGTHYNHCLEKEILSEEISKATGELANNLGVGTQDYWNPKGLEII